MQKLVTSAYTHTWKKSTYRRMIPSPEPILPVEAAR